MANTLNTLKNAPGVIAKVAAAMLADKTQFVKSIDKADESDFNGMNGYNAGDTIYINKLSRFIPGTSADITSSIQAITEEKAALTLNIRRVVPIALTSQEIATDMALKSWANRVLDPAMSSMAQFVEKDALVKAVNATYNAVGTPGSTVFDTDTMLSAQQKINENACPDFDNRFALLNPAASRSAVNARKGLFQSAEAIAEQYKNGLMGIADGFAYLTNNLMPYQTNGLHSGTVVVNTAVFTPVTGASQIGVSGLTATTGTVLTGTVFTMASVYAVHPITKQTLTSLQQFVVTADATANGSGQATLSISPAYYSSTSGALQNVSALPANSASVAFVGSASTSYPINLAYHKSAFRFASVPLITPGGVDMAAQETYEGFTVRVIRQYTVLTDQLIMRIDFLGGLAATRPEWACRIYG